MKEEIWKDVPGYEGLYQVSSHGRIMNKVGYIMTPRISNSGYQRISLWINGIYHPFSVHRLVAKVYVPNPLCKEQVNHIDGNKLNNCADNLEWVTQSENMKHAVRTGLQKKYYGREHSNSRPIAQFSLDGKLIKTFECAKRAAEELGVAQGNISKCARGEMNKSYGFKWLYLDGSSN
jgi:hypothetical protein